MKEDNMERNRIIDHERLASNIATERYQPHHGVNKLAEAPMNHRGAVGVISTITTGPTGVGAVYSMAEPLPSGWHDVPPSTGQPLVARAIGA